jgi:hypothetical protein
VTGTALKKPVNTQNVQATTMSNGDTDELTARIDRLEHEIAKLKSERETVLTGWPNEPTIAQGFMAGRWQRRDGDGYTQAIANIPEAPFDNNYYGRYQYTWQPVVEEAPAATARRSVNGWARASAGSDVTWLNLDDILANYQPAGDYAPAGNYLDKAGGQMSGPLITRDGGSATNPGLAIGENSTGFYRTAGNLLVTTLSGVIVMQVQPTIAAIFIQLDMTNKRITSVGDAVADTDALNLRTADGRYAPVGSARARPVVYDIPADIPIPASGAWTLIATVPITLPSRPGVASLLMVSVNCNLSGVNNVAGIGARIPISPTPEQRIFGFGGTATDPSAGFSVNFFVTSSPGATTFSIPVQLNAFPITGGSPIPYTVVGGNVLVIDRSQIVIVDLGPV